MILISILIAITYFILIIAFIIGFNKIECVKNKNTPAKNTFSIVIPFRNEAHNLSNLLTSLYSLSYPYNLFEVLLVNDNSSDNYLDVINSFTTKNGTVDIRILQSSEPFTSPKKDAINLGVKNTTFNWIVTTDADCVVPKNWLQLFNQIIEEKKPSFISAPVKFKTQNSFLYHFQNLNFTSLIGSSIGSFGLKKPFMCNGANLCYKKDAFIEVKGFEGNSKIASGDDVFLLEKMSATFPDKTLYLKSTEAIVQTNSEYSLTSFFNQQIRWASKASAYKSNFSKFVGLTVFIMNLTLIVLLILTILNTLFWKYLLAIFIQKLVIDFILILKTAIFLNNKRSLKYYIITSFLYPFFIVFTGFLSLFKSYEWKGRNFKK